MKIQVFVILEKAMPKTGNYERFKLGGGQAYNCQSDYAAVVDRATTAVLSLDCGGLVCILYIYIYTHTELLSIKVSILI
jgi:hypothetical protein